MSERLDQLPLFHKEDPGIIDNTLSHAASCMCEGTVIQQTTRYRDGMCTTQLRCVKCDATVKTPRMPSYAHAMKRAAQTWMHLQTLVAGVP